MKILVTGGSGFIGSHVVDRLREYGVRVRIFDLVYPTFRNDVEFYHGSLLDYEAIEKSMSGVDYVIHMGAVADVNTVIAHPVRAENINVRGTVHVLEAARRCHVKRVIYVSTIWVYSDTEVDPITEETPITPPAHLYTATKLAGEHYCICYQKLYGLPYTILRYGIPYGPRARGETVISLFVERALQKLPLSINGKGDQYRKFVHVDDLADGTVQALRGQAENQIYNLEGNEKITIRQLAEMVIERVNPQVPIEFLPGREGDFRGKNIPNLKAFRELGWSPIVRFEDGLGGVIETLMKRQNERSIDEILDQKLSRRDTNEDVEVQPSASPGNS